MSLEKVALAINKIVKADVNSITPETVLEDIGIDSLKAISLLFELEEAFDIEIPNEVIPSIVTVNDILVRLDDSRS